MTEVPPSRNVWRVFPGAGYKFLEQFRLNGEIFLDLPALSLPDRRNVVANIDKLPARVLSSAWAAKQLLENGSAYNIDGDFNLFDGEKLTTNTSKLVNSVRRFHTQVARRDIILVPEPVSPGFILVGEVRTAAGIVNKTRFASSYGRHPIFSKGVRWLTRVKDQKLSKDLLRPLRHENNLTPIKKDLYHEAFSLAYNNYTYQGLFGATVFNTEDDFRNTDAAILGFLSNLCAYATQNAETPPNEQKANDLLDIVLGNFLPEFASAQSSRIYSEGFTRNLSSKVGPILFSGIITMGIYLGGCVSLDEFNAKVEQLYFVNSKANGGECNAQVHAAAQALFAGMPREQLYETCKKLAQSDSHTEYRTGSEVQDTGRSVSEHQEKRQ